MNNKRKSYIINNEEVVVEAENALYSGVSGTDNVAGALDSIKGELEDVDEQLTDIDTRIDALENSSGSDAVAVYTYTEADCTIENSGIYSNGTEGANTRYDSTDYIPIPKNMKVKMYIKTDYTFYAYGLYFYTKKTGTYTFMLNTAIVYTGPFTDYTELTIPDNADAIRYSFDKQAGTHIYVKFVEQVVKDDIVKLKVASWNIGGLSGGSSSSTITDENVEEKRAAYRKQFDEANADIVCLSEYSAIFNTSTSSTTRDEILCNYPYYKLGDVQTYNYNCVFSKFPILSTRTIYFTEHGQARYLKEVTLKFNGKLVKVVATHLDWENDAGTINYYIPQLQELVEIYANDPYVIIGADFNIHTTDKMGDYVDGSGTDGYKNYQYLTNAGYTLMNFDYITITNPWKYPNGTLKGSTADNIAVKGFAMGKREYIYTENVSNELSDHAMVACELVML